MHCAASVDFLATVPSTAIVSSVALDVSDVFVFLSGQDVDAVELTQRRRYLFGNAAKDLILVGVREERDNINNEFILLLLAAPSPNQRVAIQIIMWLSFCRRRSRGRGFVVSFSAARLHVGNRSLCNVPKKGLGGWREGKLFYSHTNRHQPSTNHQPFIIFLCFHLLPPIPGAST